MAQSTYVRPVGLVFGSDASRLIAEGKAGALGGHQQVAFLRVEMIERGAGELRRETVPFRDLASSQAMAAVTSVRPDFAGVSLTSTRVMGIVNVTPDSFSDGGQLGSTDAAIAHGLSLVDQGADLVDVGGESTRPGSDTVPVGRELERVMPVVAGLAGKAKVSVDTRKAEVMRQAAGAGAVVVNDVSALSHDDAGVGTVRDAQVSVIIMHAQGEPKTMQLSPRYEHVALEVYDFLAARIAALTDAGIPKARIMIDPGIGFGKSYKHNLDILSELTIFHGLGVGLLVGLSRKSIVGALTGEKVAAQRVAGSVGGALQASLYGAHMLRVHDVKPTIDALRMFWGAMDPDSTDV
jgi:dihydropteroate synthase